MPVPDTMRHVACAGHGGPEVMKIVSGPVPEPGPGEILIEVHAAGVNRPDIQQRRGAYPPPPGASPILGLEAAGTVAALGAGVEGWKVGDPVTALCNGGGYAEYVAVPAPQCLPPPEGYDHLHAAALPETYFTVWANLFQRGRLAKGETVLIHGGSSGIGTTAIQLAREFGARVFATAGNVDKCTACLRLGAEAAIDYNAQDFVEEVKRLTDGRGVDVVLDMVGGDYIARNLRCLALEGRLVQIAFLQGSKTRDFDFLPVMTKRLTITGSTMRPRTTEQKGAIAAELRARVWPVLSAGRCRPVIYGTYALEDVADAHRLMESSAHIGKIMLTLR
ncbi:NAD(P)H-quinone oxidoreductase [Elioraea tepidiphila]|jgi:NADPH2:quinone reductase|uniref:NAD(P)H-quinone oxidoreductase n=1 Tax=Elioraea tepidiphila TaxID=457934 RepID=UPI00036CF493|nr:NAD(P)H-quinone oxidoreductase [Elioraea tepidiphila]